MVKSNRHGRSLTEPPWESTSRAGVGIRIGGYQSYTRTWVYAISASAKHSNTASHHWSTHSIQHNNCFGRVVCVLVSTSLAWSDRTEPWLICFSLLLPIASASAVAPWLHPLQLLLPDCIHFSCCSSTVSACYDTHTVKSIISTKVACHYSSPAPLL